MPAITDGKLMLGNTVLASPGNKTVGYAPPSRQATASSANPRSNGDVNGPFKPEDFGAEGVASKYAKPRNPAASEYTFHQDMSLSLAEFQGRKSQNPASTPGAQGGPAKTPQNAASTLDAERGPSKTWV